MFHGSWLGTMAASSSLSHALNSRAEEVFWSHSPLIGHEPITNALIVCIRVPVTVQHLRRSMPLLLDAENSSTAKTGVAQPLTLSQWRRLVGYYASRGIADLEAGNAFEYLQQGEVARSGESATVSGEEIRLASLNTLLGQFGLPALSAETAGAVTRVVSRPRLSRTDALVGEQRGGSPTAATRETFLNAATFHDRIVASGYPAERTEPLHQTASLASSQGSSWLNEVYGPIPTASSHADDASRARQRKSLFVGSEPASRAIALWDTVEAQRKGSTRRFTRSHRMSFRMGSSLHSQMPSTNVSGPSSIMEHSLKVSMSPGETGPLAGLGKSLNVLVDPDESPFDCSYVSKRSAMSSSLQRRAPSDLTSPIPPERRTVAVQTDAPSFVETYYGPCVAHRSTTTHGPGCCGAVRVVSNIEVLRHQREGPRPAGSSVGVSRTAVH